MKNKKCTKCKEERVETDFSFTDKKANRRRAMCKYCVRELTARHYTDKKEVYRLNQRTRRDRNRDFVKAYLKKSVCIDCGNKDWRVLEFDHVRGEKIENISRLMSDRAPIAVLKEEIAKCDIRCANCHRIATHTRQNNYRVK